MADNLTLNTGTGGATAAADDILGVHYQRVKVVLGADGTNDGDVASANPMPVTGTITAVTSLTNALPAGDNNIGNVDLASAIPAGTNNIGDVDVASIAAGDNNIGNVDIVTFPAEAHSADYDSGAGTDTTLAFGIAVPASGGAAVITGDATNGLDVDVTRVTGTVMVDGSGVTQPVSHAALTELAAAINASSQMDVNLAASNATVTVTATNLDIRDLTSVSDSVAAAQSGTWTVQPGNTANTTAWLVSPTPATSGGLTIFRSIDLDETEEEVKASAGQIYGIWFSNLATSTRFLKIYNATAANVTVGTTTPVITIALPGNSSDDISGVVASTHGIAFDTAITVAATTGIADNDTGAPGANEVICNVFFK